MMLRRISLAIGVAALPLAAAAAPSPTPSAAAPSATASATAGAVRDGGMIEGRVVSVDYQRNMLGVIAGTRGKIDVSVMPSTSIQGKDAGYHGFSDIKPGQRVQIFLSVANGNNVAQIIRLP
jgi:hypothetical protein